MSLISIRQYAKKDRKAWNNFLSTAINSTILHDRDYLEYHEDKFIDCSLIFEINSTIIAVMPANRSEDCLYSHQGLTYGGLVTNRKVGAAMTCEILSVLKNYLTELGFKKLFYKPVPHIFHRLPFEADIYALLSMDAKIVGNDLSSAIDLNSPLRFSKSKRQGINRAEKNGVIIQQSNLWSDFWLILSNRLSEAHNTKPVHTISEMLTLHHRFPSNIKLFSAHKDNEILAGIVLYDCGPCLHTQYMAATEIGREIGALDLTVKHIIERNLGQANYLNFGISTTKAGRNLNIGLSRQKEMFGAQGIIFMELQLELD